MEFTGKHLGAAVAEWLSSWLAEQEVWGSIPRLATWISGTSYLLLARRDMAEIPLKRRKSSIQPTNQQANIWLRATKYLSVATLNVWWVSTHHIPNFWPNWVPERSEIKRKRNRSDLTESYDKKPYTNRFFLKLTTRKCKQKLRLYYNCRPT